MRLKWGIHELEVYDTIERLPIGRHQGFNLNLLLDAGIGGDLSAFDSHIFKIQKMIEKGEDGNALVELTNMRQNVHFIMSGLNPEVRAFLFMIKKIDGRWLSEDDFSEDGINDLVKELSRKKLEVGIMRRFMERLKKKIEYEFEAYFPKLSGGGLIREYYARLKRRTLLILESIEDNSDKLQKEIEEITDYLLLSIKPKIYGGSNGLEVRYKRGFEQACNLITHYKLSTHPRELTTLAFYEALEDARQIVKNRTKKKK